MHATVKQPDHHAQQNESDRELLGDLQSALKQEAFVSEPDIIGILNRLEYQSASLTFQRSHEEYLHFANLYLSLLVLYRQRQDLSAKAQSLLEDHLHALVLGVKIHSDTCLNKLLVFTLKNNMVTVMLHFGKLSKASELLAEIIPHLEVEVLSDKSFCLMMNPGAFIRAKNTPLEPDMKKKVSILLSSYLNLVLCTKNSTAPKADFCLQSLITIVKQGYKIASQVLGEEEFKLKFKNVLKSLLSRALPLAQDKPVQSKSQDLKKGPVKDRKRIDEFIQQINSEMKGNFKVFRKREKEVSKEERLATQSQVSTFRKPLALRFNEKRSPASPVNSPPNEPAYFMPVSIQTGYYQSSGLRKPKKIAELSKSAEKSFRISSDPRAVSNTKEKKLFLEAGRESKSIRGVQKLSTQGTQHFCTSPQTFQRGPAQAELALPSAAQSERIELFPKKKPRGGSFSGTINPGPPNSDLFPQNHGVCDKIASHGKSACNQQSSKKLKLIDFGTDVNFQRSKDEVPVQCSETSLSKQRKRYSVEVPTVQSTLIYDNMKDPALHHALQSSPGPAQQLPVANAGGDPRSLASAQTGETSVQKKSSPVDRRDAALGESEDAASQASRRTYLKRATSIEKTIKSEDHITEGTGSSPVNLPNRQSLNTAKKTSEIGLKPVDDEERSDEQFAAPLSKPNLVILPLEIIDVPPSPKMVPRSVGGKGATHSTSNFQHMLSPVLEASRPNPNDQSMIDDPDFPPETNDDKMWEPPADRESPADREFVLESFLNQDPPEQQQNDHSFHHLAPVRAADEKNHLLSIIDALMKQNSELHLKLDSSKSVRKNTMLSRSIVLGDTSFQKQGIFDRHDTTVYQNRILQREEVKDAESFAMQGHNHSMSMNMPTDMLLRDEQSPVTQSIEKSAAFLNPNRLLQAAKTAPQKKSATPKQSLFAIKAQEAKESVLSSQKLIQRKQSTSEANLLQPRESSPIVTASAANLTVKTTPTENSSRIKSLNLDLGTPLSKDDTPSKRKYLKPNSLIIDREKLKENFKGDSVTVVRTHTIESFNDTPCSYIRASLSADKKEFSFELNVYLTEREVGDDKSEVSQMRTMNTRQVVMREREFFEQLCGCEQAYIDLSPNFILINESVEFLLRHLVVRFLDIEVDHQKRIIRPVIKQRPTPLFQVDNITYLSNQYAAVLIHNYQCRFWLAIINKTTQK